MSGNSTTGFEATMAVDAASLQARVSHVHERDSPETRRRPQRIGRYLVVDELGRGGMGVVYAAYDPELDRKVAIKLLLSDRRGADARARLLREAQAMARLSHAHVVHVHDVGTTREGDVFVAMEFIEGSTLGGWLRAAPRSVDEILSMFRDAGAGLAAAHAVGLTHRDFKP